MRTLITGGAGFIGSHLADELLEQGHQVRVLDSLDPQVHEQGTRPDYLASEVELIQGDVCEAEALERALRDVDAVIHFAAAVGVGQSMYEVVRYTRTNNLGTANLMEALIRRPVEKLIVASSMSLYGEGAYVDERGQPRMAAPRSQQRLREGDWECRDEEGRALRPVPTPETKPAEPSSVYALSKYDQERLCLIVGEAYNIPTTALRFFNAYGPRQALSNPYTGVLAIFASALLNDKQPKIFEDGEQRRDFVNVRDVARCCRLALESPAAAGECFNVGSGQSYSVRQVADELMKALGRSDLAPEVTRRFRAGDIRHCFADIGKARRLLGYEPQVTLQQGLVELSEWLEGQIAHDRTESAHRELAERGLTL
jgi:dTDP-L-rhamnose 4-epimerase